ncbi:carboxylic ester hydrolase [Amyelois transitella]|uniref:carboxylic ester hydrolase n=1 Tax=Amyelois transitella TaxID=680683 RepID=UPI00298FBBB3|nr:carboxylic ester hydrolase [Amyelois transitella]
MCSLQNMCDPSTSDENNMEISTKEVCVVHTEYGAVRGYEYVDNSNGQTFYKFKKVPYAVPPIGHLRFRPPVPISRWMGEIDCTQDTPMPISLNNTQLSSEDCLYVEISSPNISPSKPLPVMFWIGSVNYSYCFDEIYDPTALNNSGVIFVRCGFRIGPFGFLSMNDLAAPGNCGLKDIVMALKWIQNNIIHFGGDPTNVTLFGSNSGGSLVHLMAFSPSAAGLFQKAIVQSACALNNWSITLNPSKAVIELARQVGIENTDKDEIIEELRSLPAQTIMKGFYELCLQTHDTDCVDAIFKPCIEEEFEGQQAFLTKSPLVLIKSGVYNKVPMIIGSNNIEGAMMAHIRNDFYNNIKTFNVCSLRPFSEESKSIRTLSRKKLLRFVLGDNENSTEASRQYSQMVSDFYFLYHINKTVRLHSEYGPNTPLFYYIFNCYVEYTGIKDTNFLTGYCAELRFLFPTKFQNMGTSNINLDSLVTSNKMIKMWTNFAKYGHPTPEEDPLLQVTWSPVENNERLNYINIGYDLTVGRNPFYDRMKFWDEIHDKNDILKWVIYFNEMGIKW